MKPVRKSRRNVVNNKEIDLKNNKMIDGIVIVSKTEMIAKTKVMTVEIKGMIVVAIKLEMVKDVQIL